LIVIGTNKSQINFIYLTAEIVGADSPTNYYIINCLIKTAQKRVYRCAR
jgi:hypothetical protein